MKERVNDIFDVVVVSLLAVLPLAIMAVFFYGLFSFFSPRACGMEGSQMNLYIKGNNK